MDKPKKPHSEGEVLASVAPLASSVVIRDATTGALLAGAKQSEPAVVEPAPAPLSEEQSASDVQRSVANTTSSRPAAAESIQSKLAPRKATSKKLVAPRESSPRQQVVSAFVVQATLDGSKRLFFSPNPEFLGKVIPIEQSELQRAFDVTLNVVRRATQGKDDVYADDFARLLGYAEVIFNDSPAMLANGYKWLADFRQEVLDREGPALKNAYLRELAMVALISSGGILVFSLLIQVLTAAYHKWLAPTVGMTIALTDKVQFDLLSAPFHVGIAMAASMWGIWLSRFWSCSTLEFTQLNVIEADMLRPWARFLGYGLTALFAMLILMSGIVSFNLGSLSALHLGDNILVALVVGLALGFLDKALPDFIRRPLEAAMAGSTKKISPSQGKVNAPHRAQDER